MDHCPGSYLINQKDEILSDISSILKIPSITSDRKQTGEALEWVRKKAIDMGLCAGYAVADEVVLISAGLGNWCKDKKTIDKSMKALKDAMASSDKETIGILAHVDVVPAPGEWKYGPFEGSIEEGFIWGRGVVDDKGPLVLCLHALKAINIEVRKSTFRRQALMIIGSREEEKWTDMAAFHKLGIKPDFGFTPDGEFPIANAEKGYVDIVLKAARGPVDKNVVLEGGSASNMIPDHALAKIADADVNTCRIIEAKGQSTHSSTPEKGINAIYLLSEAVKDADLAGAAADMMGFIKCCCSDYSGADLGIDSGDVTIGEDYFHRNIVAPTLLRTTNDYYELTLNSRTTWGYTGERLLKQINKKATAFNLSAEIIESMDPILIPREAVFIKTLADVYRTETGDSDLYALAYGSSYAKAMPNIVSFGPIFPGDPDTCHEINERVSIEQLLKAASIYFETLFRLCL
jgi:succinyl-diaminopimelate desuccinylase